MQSEPSSMQQIKRQIESIEYLFQNKQLDEFVKRVEKYILPHYEKCHHSGSYKEKPDTIIKNKQQSKKDEEQVKQIISEINAMQKQQELQEHKQQPKQHQTEVQQQKLQQQEMFDSSELDQLKLIQSQSQQLQKQIQTKSEQQKQKQPEKQNSPQKQISTKEIQQIPQSKEQQAIQDKQEAKEDQLELINQNKNQQTQQLKFVNQTQPQKSKPKQQLLIVKQQIAAKDESQPQKNAQQSKKQNIQQKHQHKQTFSLSFSQKIKSAVKHSKIHILQKYDQMKFILFKIQREMQKLQTPMTDNKQWKVNKINAASFIGVKTKGTLVQIRYEGIVQTNIFNLCVMIYLSELYKQWVPFCTGSKTITEPSPLQKIVLMDLKIPFLTQRYAYLHGIAIDRITKNGKLYIYAEGITHEKQLLTHVHKADKAEYQKKVAKSVVLDAKYMVCQIGNQGNGKYSVKVYGMIDTHMPLLPEKIVNYIVKQLGGMIFDKIVKKAKDIKNTPWQKQLKANQKRQQKNRFYDWLNERVSNWDKTQTLRKSKI